MSSGTQIDLDVPSADAGQGGAANPPPSGANGAGAGTKAYLTDEEILGLEPVGAPRQQRDSSARSVPRNDGASSDDRGPTPTDRDASASRQAETPRNDNRQGSAARQPNSESMPEWMQSLAGDPKHEAEAQQLWQEHQAFRASFSSPDEARAIKELFPGGAQEARTLKQAAQAVDQLDAAIYSGDARAQSEVVAELARANPAAFRQLFAEAAKVLGNLPAIAPAAATAQASPQAPTAQAAGQGAAPAPQFDAAAYAAFERSTNDVVARDVRAAVSDTLARVLPEGMAEGAARRIGDDIFNEIHRTLAADRTLSEQVGDALRDRRFGAAEQQRVAALLAGRAKQLVPAVARRVIGEWTSSVLGTARTKAARQAAAAARVDIAAPGGSLDSMPLRPMSAREIDYAAMSDDDILGM